ncbi:hypothetical protein TARUN_3883 [Trichoderma arundinaceum]|uniref:Uncharacterized protein n=1 Tax=Trichoderma arundinaceum TaxID=490622 RepID=A0A395NR05_TRIAR|nr:hypothetical protein TARUN_3883 [Trichoderma arundinaceum]
MALAISWRQKLRKRSGLAPPNAVWTQPRPELSCHGLAAGFATDFAMVRVWNDHGSFAAATGRHDAKNALKPPSKMDFVASVGGGSFRNRPRCDLIVSSQIRRFSVGASMPLATNASYQQELQIAIS